MTARPSAAPQLGLALGGGAILGAAHLGVLRAVSVRGLRPSIITGTSVGALVGAASAAGLGVDDIESWALGFSWARIGRAGTAPRCTSPGRCEQLS